MFHLKNSFSPKEIHENRIIGNINIMYNNNVKQLCTFNKRTIRKKKFNVYTRRHGAWMNILGNQVLDNLTYFRIPKII